MKTDYEKAKADLSRRNEKVKLLSDVLNEYLPDQFEVDHLIFAMMELSDFMNEQNSLRADNLLSEIRNIEEILNKSGDAKAISNFKGISDSILTATIFAGRHSESMSMIYQMSNDLSEITSL
jgi:hypothetical protein